MGVFLCRCSQHPPDPGPVVSQIFFQRIAVIQHELRVLGQIAQAIKQRIQILAEMLRQRQQFADGKMECFFCSDIANVQPICFHDSSP